MAKSKPDHSYKSVIYFLFSAAAYILLAYFTDRSDFLQLISLYSAAFILFIGFYFRLQSEEEVNAGVWAGIFFRLIVLLNIPNLSDDFYRFLWDGKLLANGFNPYLFLPSEVAELQGGIYAEQLHQVVLAKNYFTVYPPLLQYIFYTAAKIAPDSFFLATIILKIYIFLFEIGSIILIRKLLRHFHLPSKAAILYILNPLIIIELTGNIHFEAAMIFFMLLSIWLLVNEHWIFSAIAMGLAVSAKLLPLIFLIFFFRRIGFIKAAMYGAVAVGTFILTYIPFDIFNAVPNLLKSVSLYFQHFEFNGSIYFILRWMGFQVKSYNIIHEIAPYLTATTFLLIIFVALIDKKRDELSLFQLFLFSLTIYFMLATTVNPWYLAPLVCFSIFTCYSYVIIWSFLIMLTYVTFQYESYQEEMWIIIGEYIIVYAVIIYELFYSKPLWASEKSRSLLEQ